MSFRAALSTFTILPVGRAVELGPDDGPRMLLCLPFIGVGLGAAAGLPVAGILSLRGSAWFVAAVVGVGVLAVLSRGLHLDGLADTADGLGSRAPAERALEIMRQSDIGPFGVITLVFVLGLDISCVAMLSEHRWQACAALGVAAATGRLAVVHAALRGVASARPSGFGALVAGSVSIPIAVAETVAVLGIGAGLAAACNWNPLKWMAAQVVALGVCYLLRLHTTRRFGGVTGDVFGALVEVGTAVTLLGIALS